MKETELSALLTRELRTVAAPAGMWAKVQAGLHAAPRERDSRWRVSPLWTYGLAAAGLLLAISMGWNRSVRTERAIDLQAYLAPVQNASMETSESAISLAPPHFRNASDADGPAWVAGYRVTARREADVEGRAVKQMVLTAANESVALFITPPHVPMRTGRNYWVDSSISGIACKRLNCPRTRTMQFACWRETCTLVCKACSEGAMLALIQGLEAAPEIMR